MLSTVEVLPLKGYKNVLQDYNKYYYYQVGELVIFNLFEFILFFPSHSNVLIINYVKNFFQCYIFWLVL